MSECEISEEEDEEDEREWELWGEKRKRDLGIS